MGCKYHTRTHITKKTPITCIRIRIMNIIVLILVRRIFCIYSGFLHLKRLN